LDGDLIVERRRQLKSAIETSGLISNESECRAIARLMEFDKKNELDIIQVKQIKQQLLFNNNNNKI
jgi:hypothetical protein